MEYALKLLASELLKGSPDDGSYNGSFVSDTNPVSVTNPAKCITPQTVGVSCNYTLNTGCQEDLKCFNSKGSRATEGTCLKAFGVACAASTECRFGLGCDLNSNTCKILFGGSCKLKESCITENDISLVNYAGSACLLAKDYFNRPNTFKKPSGKVCVYLLKKDSDCQSKYSPLSKFYKCAGGTCNNKNNKCVLSV